MIYDLFLFGWSKPPLLNKEPPPTNPRLAAGEEAFHDVNFGHYYTVNELNNSFADQDL